MQEFVTHSREETVAVGRELAKTLPVGALIAFTGGLGGSGTGGSVKSTRIVSPGLSVTGEKSNDTSANEPASSTP